MSVPRPDAPAVLAPPRALLFDVFGTCVDWRRGIAEAGAAVGRRIGRRDVDWHALADAWRARYRPQLDTVRRGARPWVTLDVLHAEALDEVLWRFDLALPAAEQRALVHAWHRLPPWPDTVDGLARLRRRFVIAPASNGHIALLVTLARHGGYGWDAILGAEPAGAYKPDARVYEHAVAALGLAPSEVMMVAAHNGDLAAARALGLRTAFVLRATEHGPGQTTDLEPEGPVDVAATDLRDLAVRLGA